MSAVPGIEHNGLVVGGRRVEGRERGPFLGRQPRVEKRLGQLSGERPHG